MLVIRLTRVGKKNTPAFRVVVADKKKAVKRQFIEVLGHYNPAMTPKTVVINKEKALKWIGEGAQPSDTVLNLMCDLGILPKNKKIKIVYGKATKKKDKNKTEEKAEVKAESAIIDTDSAEPSVPATEESVENPSDDSTKTTNLKAESETVEEPIKTEE